MWTNPKNQIISMELKDPKLVQDPIREYIHKAAKLKFKFSIEIPDPYAKVRKCVAKLEIIFHAFTFLLTLLYLI